MAVQYYFDALDPTTFQRLINSLLNAHFGEQLRLYPLRGKDGGQDAATPSPFRFEMDEQSMRHLLAGIRHEPGRYLFQVKHHRMSDHQAAAVRANVVADFVQELTANVLLREPHERVNQFFLVTNVPSSKEAITKIDEKRKELLAGFNEIHADVLWQEHVIAWLDQSPNIWHAFPELFAGMKVPTLGQVADPDSQGLPRSLRMALRTQYTRDSVVRFRQISLEHSLFRLFVDLDVQGPHWIWPEFDVPHRDGSGTGPYYFSERRGVSSISALLTESQKSGRIILEGGPGQGKSTVTQMVTQLYRAMFLGDVPEYRQASLSIPKARFPFRVELRLFAESLGARDRSIEEFIAETFSKEAGGARITVEDIHSLAERQPMIFIFDGLDEVGSDDLRDTVIQKILECIDRLQNEPDLRVVITSRPPAIAGRISKLAAFQRLQIMPLSEDQVRDYVQRWTEAICQDAFERERVVESFEKRKPEQHVRALVKNPMQLSVLLHFIRLKGEAFPDRRAELYREYFRTVIDRDVEKSPELRRNRDDIEALHEVIGFEIHSRAESDNAASTLSHGQLIDVVQKWLSAQGRKTEVAYELFRLGEERLGLIVALSGEGTETRYGFEVQPVREYFAAAFINDKWEANAHDLFQAMVRRSFWREVALFLAGLRRANEKADLVSRARALDADKTEGWRSDGRAIVLQLLQEGVLTNPGHVFNDAIAFLLQFFDPADRSPRYQPKDIVSALPAAIRAHDGAQPRRLLTDLLEKSRNDEDRYSLWRLWRVVHKALPREEAERYAFGYESAREDLEPQVKLLWPAQASSSFLSMEKVKGILSGPPQRAWAERWFEASFLDNALTRLEDTSRYHEFLFEQFAFQPFLRETYLESTEPFVPQSEYAVWHLCSNLQLIATSLVDRESRPQPTSGPVSYAGLSELTLNCVTELVESSKSAVDKLAASSAYPKAMRGFLETLERLVQSDGLSGWIACRCAVTLLHYLNARRFVNQGGRRWVVRVGDSPISGMRSWARLKRLLTPYFRSALPKDLTLDGRTMAHRILELDLQRSVPSHVRIGGEWKSIAEILIGEIKQSKAPDWGWISRIPIPHYWVPELLKNDPNLAVLPSLAKRRANLYGLKRRLGTSQIRHIVSSVQRSDDLAFSAGALFVLLNSAFWEVGDMATCAKMIEADAEFMDIASKVFENRQFGSMQSRHANLVDLANAVVLRKIKASQGTATAASRLLVENRALKFPPLSSVVDSLKLAAAAKEGNPA